MAACVRHVSSLRTILLRTQSRTPKLPWLQTPHKALHTRPLLANTRSLWLRSSPHERHPVWICATVAGIRNSSTGSDVSLPGYIPDPPPIPVPEVPVETVELLNALGEPTLASQGLGGYSPVGLLQNLLETLHVSYDLPWWGAIVCMTVVLRICLFPLVILSQKNAANMANHMPTVQRLQGKFSEARASGNPMEAARAAQNLMDYMKANNVKPLRNAMVPFAQFPIFMSVFLGIRGMTQLPVESMQTGGLFWFTDLTIADPFYLLPIITSATLLMTIEVGSDGVRSGSMTPMVRTVLRAMPVIMFPVIMQFPSAMLCYWFTANSFSLGQVLLLRIPAIRNYFNIPKIVKHEDSFVAKKQGFIEGFKESMNNAKMTADMQNRERMDAMKFKEAGTGPLQKTYRTNPKLQAKSKSS